jgi:hypothetical protein
MSSFDEMMFEFIVKPENWRVAREILERGDDIKGRLLRDFWSDVKCAVESGLSVNEWEFKINENISDDYSLLSIAHKSWNGMFSIAYEGLHTRTLIGVYRDFDSHNVSDAIHQQISTVLREIYKNSEPAEDWWCIWFYTGEDFAQLSLYDKLLPTKKKDLVDRYAATMLELKSKSMPHIEAAIAALR